MTDSEIEKQIKIIRDQVVDNIDYHFKEYLMVDIVGQSELETIIDEMDWYYYTAGMLASLGRYEEALPWLEKAYQAHQTTDILSVNIFKPLYDEPRFQAILKGMGLAE